MKQKALFLMGVIIIFLCVGGCKKKIDSITIHLEEADVKLMETPLQELLDRGYTFENEASSKGITSLKGRTFTSAKSFALLKDGNRKGYFGLVNDSDEVQMLEKCKIMGYYAEEGADFSVDGLPNQYKNKEEILKNLGENAKEENNLVTLDQNHFTITFEFKEEELKACQISYNFNDK